MRFAVLVAGGEVLGSLEAVPEVRLFYVTADIYNPQVRVVQVLPSQFVSTRGSPCSISLFLPKEVVLANVGLGQLPSLFGIVFAQTALDDFVLKITFYVLDPTSRTLVKMLHQLVAVQGAREPLHGV